MSALDIDAISRLVTEAAHAEILPRFRTLAAEDIIEKPSLADPDDIVTTADRAAEAWLTPRLRDAFPPALVVGEEAVAADPTLLDQLAVAPWAFVVDPVDGTKNFAAGSPEFGLMIALLRHGQGVASWIYLPEGRELFVAESGAGARMNGKPLVCHAPDPPWKGTLHVRYLPEALRPQLPTWYAHLGELVPSVGSAAIEYTDVARGRKHFTTFFRLYPWDHQPGALIVRESGGAVRHLDGREYSAESGDAFTVAVGDRTLWEPLLREVFQAPV